MSPQTQSNDEEVIKQRDSCLPNILSSLQDENTKQLENIRVCAQYLKTFHITEADSRVLQWIMPVIGQCLEKIYEDNCLLTSTVEEDFALNIVRNNLKDVISFIEILKTILVYITENGNVNIRDVQSVPVATGQIIIWTFEHCKDSSESFKSTFKDELLEIFRITQEVHSLYLQVLESCVLMENGTDLDIIKEVLNIICAISDVLAKMNVKSMTNNWRGYMGLIQKFANLLEETIDLTVPMKYLMTEIIRNLFTLYNSEPSHQNFTPNAMRVINISSFLIKVAIKLFETFWTILDKTCEELLTFCCSIYSFSPERFYSQNFPCDVIDMMTKIIFKPIELFIGRLSGEQLFTKMIADRNLPPSSLSYGVLNFITISLQHVIEQEGIAQDHLRLDLIVKWIFNSIKSCSDELYWSSPTPETVFDKLIVNVSAAVMLYNQYPVVESILLQNVLQENTFSAMLAIDIWDLILSNSPPTFASYTLNMLMSKYETWNFGINTHRHESIYLKHLLERIYKNLPDAEKTTTVQKYQSVMNNWRVVSACSFILHQEDVVEKLCRVTVEKVEKMGQDSFGLEELFSIGENFEALSKVDFNNLNVDTRALANAVAVIWEMNHNDLSNNVFKYFIAKLFKITRSLILEFSAKQLFIIFNQMKFMSSDVAYKLQICSVLHAFSTKNTNDFGQDAYKMVTLIAHIIYPNLTNSTEAIIKQHAFEVIGSFHKNNKHDIVREITKVARDIQGEVGNYLQRHVEKVKLDKEYFVSLGNLKYKHNCVDWKVVIQQPNKKIKTEPPKSKEKVAQRVTTPAIVVNKEETEEERADDVTEAISNIRSDIKCLMKVLKTQNMTKKNVSDLKLLTNQLLSLM